MGRRSVTDDEEGKRVVNADGDDIGIVATVRDGRAYVDAEPVVTDAVMAKLGWRDVEDDTYPLDPDDVAEITDDEIRLRRL